MSDDPETASLWGVIEGFYGRPWHQHQRLTLFERLRDWGLNTYFYAPKDDLKHRALWRECYTPVELNSLATLISACADRNIAFFYGLGPGLDIRFAEKSEIERIQARFQQLIDTGGKHFALLFDDIPDVMSAADHERFGNFATAQAHVANTVFRWLRERVPSAGFLFCPTPYCGRMEAEGLGGKNYLDEIGRLLELEIDVFWTGPEIISETIPVISIRQLRQRLRRKPVIWDNLHANDYDLRRLYTGPYAGRELALKEEIAGVITNPNCEFEANYIPILTLGRYANTTTQTEWRAREEYQRALDLWLAEFETIGQPVTRDNLEWLGGCFYLPHSQGDVAQRFVTDVSELFSQSPTSWPTEKVQAITKRLDDIDALFEKLTQLKNRELFYTFNRQFWEIKEEAELIRTAIREIRHANGSHKPFRSAGHLPKTYRGGFVRDLQSLFVRHEDGSFHA